MQLVIISGLSGSGKSIALHVLEDNGYYCIDNLPADLLKDTSHFLQQAGYDSCAISVDIRSGTSLAQLPMQIQELRNDNIDVRVLFLEAHTRTLVKRFSESRRPHPLSNDQRTLPECIELERDMLADVGDLAQRIDTSELKTATLRTWIHDLMALDQSRITLMFQSFGFKHGIPLDADYVFDVRCLPNPYYDPALRPFTGRDACIVDFLAQEPSVVKMLADIRQFIESWTPHFTRDGRSNLTIAIGCTGGQHRSVYIAESLAQHFGQKNQVIIRHRELS